MGKLTREQVTQLTPEQQEKLALQELRRTNAKMRRQKLLVTAARRRGFVWLPGVSMFALWFVSYVTPVEKMIPFFLSIILYVVIELHATRIHRRAAQFFCL